MDELTPNTDKAKTQEYSNIPILPGKDGMDIPIINVTSTKSAAVIGNCNPRAENIN